MMLYYFKLFLNIVFLFFISIQNSLSLPKTWCVSNNKKSIMNVDQAKAPLPPMKPGSIDKCPGYYLKEISINEVKKYFLGISKAHNFDETLVLLSSAKKEIFAFFDNVKVNDESEVVKKNRLELLNFFCKTYENFIDFQLIKDIDE